MWILLRLAVAILAFCSRCIMALDPDDLIADGKFQDIDYFQRIKTDKGNTIGYQFGFRLKTLVPFQFEAESSVNRFYKWLGLSREFATGDAAFDQQIYLACDHPLLLQVLQQDPQARQAIAALLKLPGAEKIWSDGRHLWFSCSSRLPPGPADQGLLLQLVQALNPVVPATSQQPTPYLWRYLTIDGFVWALFGYALMSALEWRLQHNDYHLEQTVLLQSGFAVGLLLLAGLMLMIVLLLRGSSRSHLLITESFLLLMLAMPVCGTQLVSDLNRSQDQAAPKQVLLRISKVEKQSRTGKGWLPRHRYYLQLAQTSTVFGTPVPQTIEVTEAIYNKAAVDLQLLLVVKPGWLHLPWYQRMEILTKSARLTAK